MTDGDTPKQKYLGELRLWIWEGKGKQKNQKPLLDTLQPLNSLLCALSSSFLPFFFLPCKKLLYLDLGSSS